MALSRATNPDDWRDIASQSFVPLSFQRAAANFSASMDHRQLAPDMSLSKIHTQGLVIDRTPRLVARSDTDDIHISLQMNARGCVSQGGRVTPVAPGIVTICETHRPFTLDYAEPDQRHIVLQASRAALGVSNATISQLAGRALGRVNPARNAYVSFVCSLMATSPPVPGPARNDMAAVLVSLAAAMLRTEGSFTPVLPGGGDALLLTMLDFIRANLPSPLLTPDLVARAHHVSRRHLYTLFASIDETPSEFIRAERLRRAAAMLVAERTKDERISDVAYGLGFADLTTFSRAFTRRYGMTPRDYRETRPRES